MTTLEETEIERLQAESNSWRSKALMRANRIDELEADNEKLREGANYVRQKIKQRARKDKAVSFPDYIMDDLIEKLEAALKDG